MKSGCCVVGGYLASLGNLGWSARGCAAGDVGALGDGGGMEGEGEGGRWVLVYAL